ncbi:MAG TPA: hypothetical protein VMD91_14890 [Candidatus Sulfotelmatobacter sp.]|nr:hypothetical protein [Candidatus Sulfotelmatobacter sp.]
MLRTLLGGALALAVVANATLVACAQDVPVPAQCTPQVNAHLSDLIASNRTGEVDNVMVCGTTISASRTQRGGPHGNHEILPLRVHFPDGSAQLIQVVINDSLDGKVTAPAHAAVFAFGQYFNDGPGGHFAAGIHDVHCSTHRGADNGWVVVNGTKTPASC